MSGIKKTTIFILFFLMVLSFVPFVSEKANLSFSEDRYHTVSFYPLNGKSVKEVSVKSGETVSAPVLGEKRKGVLFEHWADEDGNVFDFNTAIEDDISLYARYVTGDTMLLSEYAYDYTEEETKLLYLNGKDNVTTVNDPGVVEHLDINANGYAAYYVHSYGFIKYPSVRFKSGVNVEDIENIVFRIYVHLSPSNMNGIDNSQGGFAIAGIESTGLAGECISLDYDITQDRWIDFTLNRYQAATLADENGKINGFAVISNFRYDPAKPNKDGTGVYIGGIEYKEGGYVNIDYVGYTEREDDACLVTMFNNNGEKTQFAKVTKGEVLANIVPEKAGYEFYRWVDEEGHAFDFSAPIFGDVVLFAEYVKSGSVSVVTFDDNNGRTFIQEVGNGNKAERPADPVRTGHNFVCWVDESGKRFDFDTEINDDIVLYARYVKNTGNVLVDFDADYRLEDSGLYSLNGYTNETLPLSDPYVADSENNLFSAYVGSENYVRFDTICWGFIKYPTLRFASVNVNDIRYLKIKVLVHLNDGKIDTRYGGFAFSSVESDGRAGTCYQIDADVEQDSWVDIVLSPAEAALLADGNGNISGISVISNFKYNDTVNPTSDGSGAYTYGYVLIDEISYEARQENDIAVYIDPLNGQSKTVEFIVKGNKISMPTEPVRDGYAFDNWTDENGDVFDFSKNIYSDTVIYARYKKGLLTYLSDIDRDYSVSETSLTALNGNTNVNTGNDPLNEPFTVYNDEGVTYARYDVSCWGFIKYPSLRFAGIHIDSVKYLKIRMKVHLNDGNIDNRYGGFALAGVTSTGRAGECYTLAADIEQDSWITVEFSPFDLALFADTDGYIKGLAVIANFKYNETINPTSDGSGVYPYGLESADCGYVLIDYIAYEAREENDVAVKINQCNGNADSVIFKHTGETLSVPETPIKDGCIFDKWIDSDGNAFDFSRPLSKDVALFAVYKTGDGRGLNILSDFDNDYIVGDYNLENINGNNRNENYVKFKVVQIEKPLYSEKSEGVSYGVFSTLNYGSVIYPALKFVSPVRLVDLDYIEIRLYVHLWDGNYDVSKGGFVICGADATGLKDECFMLAEGIKQDAWIDIVLTRSQAAQFADSEGKIAGISVGSMFTYNPATDTSGKGVYVGADGYGGYVLIDYIAYKETEHNNGVMQFNVSFNGYSEEKTVKVNAYDKISAPNVAPVKEGYTFAFWAYQGKKFDFASTAIFKDIELDPVFVYDYRTVSDYVGAYTLNGKTVVLNSDGTVRIYVGGKLYSQLNCVVLSNGNVLIGETVFARYDDVLDKLIVSDNAYTRNGGTLVYYNADGENYKTAIFGNVLPSLPAPEKDGYVFVGWYQDSGYSLPVKSGDTVSGDSVILYAKFISDIVTVTLNYPSGTAEQTQSVLVERGKKLTIGFVPEKQNCKFICWCLKNGTEYDFDSAVNTSFTLYAKFEELLEYITVADKEIDNRGTLEMVDGIRYKENSNMYAPYTVKTERVKAEGAINGYAYKTSFHTWAITVSENYIPFTDKIKVDDIDGLTIRLYTYLSPSSKYDTQSGGIKLYGLGYTGKAGEGLMLPESVKQNEWFDFIVSKADCYKLANAEGIIEGLQIGSSLFIADMNLGYEGVGMMYIMIDYVAVTEKVNVRYVTDAKTYEFEYNKGNTLEKNYVIPEKAGYMFAGWEDASGNAVSKDTVVTASVVLNAKWIEKMPLTAYVGYYVNEQGKTVSIGSTVYLTDFAVYDDICVNDGTVYVLYRGVIYSVDLAEYRKAETVTVTYDYAFGKVSVTYPKNTFIQPLDLKNTVSGFNGYVDANGYPIDFTEGFSKDTTVYADITWTEAANYSDYVGWYKNGDKIIKLTAGKKIDIFGTVTDYTVCENIIAFELNGEKHYASIYGNGIIYGESTFLKLSDRVTVSFATGALAREPEKVEITLSDGYVMQTELQSVSADGYEFLGWYNENGEKVENYAVFYESTRLFARWARTARDTAEPASGCGGNIAGDALAVCCALVVCSFILLKRRREN